MTRFCHIALIIVALSVFSFLGSPAFASSVIPFVGCAGNSQDGPVAPPAGSSVVVDVPANIAAKLAFYDGQRMGVFAPRGWTCSSVQLNAFGHLWVIPPTGNPDKGPVVAITFAVAETGPGIVYIRKYCSEYFQKICPRVGWIKAAQQYFSLSKGQALAPHYWDDRLIYLDSTLLKYVTPPNQYGLGTDLLNEAIDDSSSKISDFSTYGLILVINDPKPAYLMDFMAVRLPKNFAALRSFIFKGEIQCLAENGDFTADVNEQCLNAIK